MKRILIATIALVAVHGAGGTAAAQSSAWGDNGYFSFGGVYQASETAFSEELHPTINQETAAVGTGYRVEPGPAVDITAGGRLTGNLGMGFGFSYFRRTGAAGIAGSLPHPFFFGQPRAVTGEAGELTRDERAFHVNAMWLVPVSDRFQVALFAGPSYITVIHQSVTGLSYEDVYPYDEARFTGVETRDRRGSALGFHAGLDVSFYFGRYLGVGAIVRLTRADVELDADAGAPVPVRAGGTQAGAGFRVRF
jgi:hypothetical protein